MVNIDTVYQKVLTLANKEQRGYITPQEFNLMADKAQMEIFENYFHDMKMAYLKPKNESVYSDDMEILSEKMQVFRAKDLNNNIITGDGTGSSTNVISLSNLQVPIYRIDSIVYNWTKDLTFNDNTADPPEIISSSTTYHQSEVLELTKKENNLAESHPLTKATKSRPTFVRHGNNTIRFYPVPGPNDSLSFYYWRKPTSPRWGYVVANSKALYNLNTSMNFEIHASEEENLVTRILALSGVIINNPGLVQIAMADKVSTKQDQND